MQKVQLTGTDLILSPMGLGTAEYGAGVPVEAAEEQMDAYLAAGGNLIDTAHVYNDWVPGPRGRSELVIGAWMKRRGNRGEIILSTKGAHPLLESMHIPRCTPQDIESDLEESLRNLQTDYADLYFLHRDDPSIPAAELLGCLEEQVRRGKIRWYGCSNWSLGRMREAADCAKKEGFAGFACNQTKWSLADTNVYALADKTLVPMDREMWEYHKETGLSAMAYTSTASGYFAKRASGKAIRDTQKAAYDNATNDRIFEGLLGLSRESGVSVPMLSLLYFSGQPFPAIPLTSFSSMAQMDDSLAMLTQDYPAGMLAELSKLKKFVYR